MFIKLELKSGVTRHINFDHVRSFEVYIIENDNELFAGSLITMTDGSIYICKQAPSYFLLKLGE